jgi:hypothetical protein
MAVVVAKEPTRTHLLTISMAWVFSYPNLLKKGFFGVVQLLVAGYLLLSLMYVYNAIRVGSSDRSSSSGASVLASAFQDLRPADNALLVFHHFDTSNYMYFEYLAGSITPTALIPSRLMPFKPPADKDAELTHKVFPEGVDISIYHKGSTMTFTVPASGFADFGWLGVLVSCFVYAVIYVYFGWISQLGPSQKLLSTYLLLTHIAGLRLSVESDILGLYIALMFLIVLKVITTIRLIAK